MFKNMRVFIAHCVFFNPGREMATGFTNITGITSPVKNFRDHSVITDHARDHAFEVA